MPLLSLRPGDQVRVTQDGTVVLMFTDGQGTLTVSAANSPYTVQPPGASSGSRTTAIISDLSRFLMGKKKNLNYVPLATRGAKQPPRILSPVDGKLLSPPLLEWGGSDRLRYTVRLFGPVGKVWERADLPRVPLLYPPNAPPLTPGVSYRWELEAKDFPIQRGQFTILSMAEIAAVRENLAALEPSALAGYPKNTVILLRAGFLFEHELYAEARKELLTALSADPDEPNLHVMLGHVYERTSLMDLAAEEFDEADFLTTRSH